MQAFINNISVPKSLEELEWYIDEHGCFNVEDILMDVETEWTAPRWAKAGDIVFFMHAKYGFSYLTALRTELNNTKIKYSESRYNEMMDWINHGLALNKKYGGKIYAIARVCGMPTYEGYDSEEFFHWKSRLYAAMDKITVLDNPIDISEFSDFLLVSRQSAITPVLGKDFDNLRKIIKKQNKIPEYFEQSDATPIPCSKINRKNWMTLSNEYRRSFLFESQFRMYYVNYLLASIGDRKTIYKECRCQKVGMADSFVDNVIFINGRYLPVEVKLSIAIQNNIKTQVRKYCFDDVIFLDKDKRVIAKDKIHSNFCLVIDTEKVYVYNYYNDDLEFLFDLDTLKSIDDLEKLKSRLNAVLN